MIKREFNQHLPIIKSLLDTDLYKFTMGAVVFHNFPNVLAQYEFINRGKTQFPDGFDIQLRRQINYLCSLHFAVDEITYLKFKIPLLRNTYIDFLEGYSFDAREIKIQQEGGNLSVRVEGSWYRTILWEVFLMAIISELYFLMTGVEMAGDWESRIQKKAYELSENNCNFSDFGTRRRFSHQVQDGVVAIMKNYKGFVGTSNVYLAKTYGVKAIGTSAHEAVMAMATFVGYNNANNAWLNYWSDYYNGELGIALPDTFTTPVFLRTFDSKLARLWDGLRQDSGNPYKWMDEYVIPHYKKLNIPTRDKRIVFSDSLDVKLGVDLTKKYSDRFTIMLGIGTNFTNDVFSEEQRVIKGIRPLNMVIKLVAADFGNGFKPTVKLSDTAGKFLGHADVVNRAKTEMGIV